MGLYFIRRKTLKKFFALMVMIFLGALLVYWDLSLEKPAMVPASPIYQGQEGKKQVALACNVDWGEEYLPRMLEILKENQAKATFFLSGRWAEKHPDLVKTIWEAGHEIGNHGYSHPHPTKISREQNVREIRRTEEAIAKAADVKTVLFAPPYGEFDPAVLEAAQSLGYRTILWSIDTIDWQKPSPATIVQRVKGKLHDGAIVLMHPTAQTAQALPELLKSIADRGYKTATISEVTR